jgi:hypothetical protein
MKQIRTFADACKVEGLNPKKALPVVKNVPAKDRKALIAIAKLVIIARATNRLANDGKEWFPDWTNYSEYKYTPWFDMRGSSGFRFYDYDGWGSHSSVGSRLCFKTRELAEYTGKKFQGLYKDFMVTK